MKKKKVIIILGVLILIIPLLGIPHSWKNVLTVILALIVIGTAFSVNSSYESLKKKILNSNEKILNSDEV